MNNQKAEIPLILFAKTPELGKVKTRLQPECSENQCLEIAKILLEESVRKATRFWQGEVILCVWPTLNDTFIQRMRQDYSIALALQAQGDLGGKMYAAFQQFGYPAAIMGCDAPHISQRALTVCNAELSAENNCIGASKDGGYYLIGLSQSSKEIFKNIKWGSDEVLSSTMNIANRQSLCFKQLPVLNDVDTWQDVLEVSESLASLKNYIKTQNLI